MSGFSSKVPLNFWVALYLILLMAESNGRRLLQENPTTLAMVDTNTFSSTLTATDVLAGGVTENNLGSTTTVVIGKELKDINTKLDKLSPKYAPGAALRGLYVFIGLSAVVVLYIAAKVMSLKRNRMKMRKYGLLSNVDDVEMTPLGADNDDDDDTTLFDANHHTGR